MTQNEPDDLTIKLRAWRVQPQVPTSFQRGVWQRIATRTASRDRGFWPELVRWILVQLPRPQYALSLMAISLSLGLGLAHAQAQQVNARNMKAMEARYTSSINPLDHSRSK